MLSLRAPVRLLAFAVTVVAAFWLAPAAFAHVTVSSPDARSGGFGKLVVRVPTESESASTVKVSVTLPEKTPFAFVSTKQMPGWQVATTERNLDKPIKSEGFTLTKAVATVIWTADTGQGIAPGQFAEFELSVGPFPDADTTLVLPAVQTYDDGSVVQWDQTQVEGKAEPEHPAPTLQVTASNSAGNADNADTAARVLAVVALVVTVAVAVGVVVALRLPGRRRRT